MGVLSRRVFTLVEPGHDNFARCIGDSRHKLVSLSLVVNDSRMGPFEPSIGGHRTNDPGFRLSDSLCPDQVNIPYLIRAARGALSAIGLVPPELQSTVDTALEKGNNMGIPKVDWVETAEWLEDELKKELDDPQARLPVDEKGAKLFYAINPREAMFFPLSILAAGKIFSVPRNQRFFWSSLPAELPSLS